MIATLEFTLPEDSEEFYDASNAVRYKATLDDIDNWARGKLKHGEPSEGERTLLEDLRRMIYEGVSR